jgi:uncharacterized protein involved in exopolysaccharide biosynthesis
MPDLFYLVSKWWKQITLIVVLSVVTVIIVLFLKPRKYLAVSTAVPASTYASDKGSVFSNNMQNLYPALGTADDLDMVLGTAQLDTVYISVAEQLNLDNHYKMGEQGRAAILKAASLLKENSRVIRSEYNDLKVKAWDKDRNIAPLLANAIMNVLQSIHKDLQNSNNITMIKGLEDGLKKLQVAIDSINQNSSTADGGTVSDAKSARRTALVGQIQEYEKLISQYQLMLDNQSQVLLVVEKARASEWPDKPRTLPILAATLVLSLVFALLLAILLEKRKTA